MRREQIPPRRVLIAYLYGVALVLIGSAVVHYFNGLKMIEVLREIYIAAKTPVNPMIGFIEIDAIGLFLTALGSMTLLLTFISRTFRQARAADFLFIAVVNVFSLYYFLNAYMCDDAFITFRTVDNFIHGYGLRWNTIERVQTFTNPLWMFLVSAPYGAVYRLLPLDDITKIYYVSMVLSYCTSLTAVLWVAAHMVRENRRGALLVLLAALFSSRAFVEYTSSGLENPLSYLLIALFYTRFFGVPAHTSTHGVQSDTDHLKPAHLLFFFMTASLAFVNRMDSVLLFLFPVAWLCMRGIAAHRFKIVRILALGFLPAYGWLAFAVIYFGFPFPNSYYAKLGLGSAGVVLKQGVNYLFSILITDPISILMLVAALLLPVIRREKRVWLAGASLFASVCYIISTGGDFMGGRFVSAPFFVAVLLIAYSFPAKSYAAAEPLRAPGKKVREVRERSKPPLLKRYRLHLATCIAFVIYNAWAPFSPLKTPFHANTTRTDAVGKRLFVLPNSLNNIYQNNDYYLPSNPMFYSKDGFPFGNVKFHDINDCLHCRYLKGENIPVLIEGGGINGFCRGPRTQLIDPQAITDPLLARLPTPDISGGFVPGHIMKTVPEGLAESYSSGHNRINDRNLGAYYDKLCTVTRGKLFTMQRFRYILELNLPGNRRYAKPYS